MEKNRSKNNPKDEIMKRGKILLVGLAVVYMSGLQMYGASNILEDEEPTVFIVARASLPKLKGFILDREVERLIINSQEKERSAHRIKLQDMRKAIYDKISPLLADIENYNNNKPGRKGRHDIENGYFGIVDDFMVYGN